MKSWKHLIAFRICLLCFVLSCAAFIGYTVHSFGFLAETADSEASALSHAVILDAGHGDMDGGAVGKNGVLEKEINLSVAKKIQKLLTAQRIPVIMTRETDSFIGDTSLPSLAARKKSDMEARLQIIREHPESIFVSIHQNYFANGSNNGAQVFYSPNHENGERLANSIQNSIINHIQPENTRKSKSSDHTIYLLRNATIPAVIVECGFLSNREEAERLCDDSYQNQMAFSVFCGILNYYATK